MASPRGQIELGERRQAHLARSVHDDVDAAVGLLGQIEQTGHRLLIRDVRLDGDDAAARIGDLGHHRVGRGGVAGVVDDERVPVSGKPVHGRAPDTA